MPALPARRRWCPRVKPVLTRSSDPLSRLNRSEADTPCRRRPELWTGQDDQIDPEAAARECADCPLRRPCLRAAVDVGAQFGVWAGVNFADLAQRGAAARRVRRDRPRMSEQSNDPISE